MSKLHHGSKTGAGQDVNGEKRLSKSPSLEESDDRLLVRYHTAETQRQNIDTLLPVRSREPA